MNTPPNESKAWDQLRARAAAELPADFPDRVIRSLRLAPAEPAGLSRYFLHPFAVSLYTATLCLLVVLVIHSRNTQETNARHLADWQELSMQTASLDPL